MGQPTDGDQAKPDDGFVRTLKKYLSNPLVDSLTYKHTVLLIANITAEIQT